MKKKLNVKTRTQVFQEYKITWDRLSKLLTAERFLGWATTLLKKDESSSGPKKTSPFSLVKVIF